MNDFGDNGLVSLLVTLGVVGPAWLIVRAWIVDRTLDFATAWLLATALVVGATAVLQSAGTAWIYAGLVCLAAGCVTLPILNWWSDRKMLRELNDEAIEKCRAALRFDPKNATAHALMAQAWCDRGQYESAISEYEAALALKPNGEPAGRWRWHLQRLREERQQAGQPRSRRFKPGNFIRRCLARRAKLTRLRWLRCFGSALVAANIGAAIVSVDTPLERAGIFCAAACLLTAISWRQPDRPVNT